ncbi:MAG: DUF983 domain-containing protein [Deltaproteobacteria bacterium]
MSENQKLPGGGSGSKFRTIWRGQCPRCRQGRIFSGSFSMNEPCPVCGLQFGREGGYFTGAMFISYTLAVPILGAIILILWYGMFPHWRFSWIISLSSALFLPFVPAVFRYSRIIWIHVDRYIDP